MNKDIQNSIANNLPLSDAIKLVKHNFVRVFKVKGWKNIPSFIRPCVPYFNSEAIYIVDKLGSCKYMAQMQADDVRIYIKNGKEFYEIGLFPEEQRASLVVYTMKEYDIEIAKQVIKELFNKLVFSRSKNFKVLASKIVLNSVKNYVYPKNFKIIEIPVQSYRKKKFRYVFDDCVVVIAFDAMQDDEELVITPIINITTKTFKATYELNDASVSKSIDITPFWTKAYSAATSLFDGMDKEKYAKLHSIDRFKKLIFETYVEKKPLFKIK